MQIDLLDRTIDLAALTVRSAQGVKTLTAKESEVVAYLLAAGGRAVSREELLREVWGHVASVQTRAVDHLVRRLRQKLEADPHQPRSLRSVYGKGYLLDVPLLAIGLEHDHEMLGRDDALTDLDALAKQGAVVVVGPAGVGKSRLARVWCHVAPQHLWVSLAQARTLHDVAVTVAAALKLRTAPSTKARLHGAALSLSTWETGRLVLDDVEGVIDVLTPFVDTIEQMASRVALVLTSRVASRTVFCLHLQPLPRPAAEALFLREARRVQPSLSPSAAVSELLDHLDHLPLTLKLAASLAGVMSPAQLVKRLGDPVKLLSPAGLDGRHDSLYAAIDHSWQLLTAAERLVLQAASVFIGDFTAQDLHTIVGVAAHETVQVLAALQRASLVQSWMSDGKVRLELLASVRSFATLHLGGGRLARALFDAHGSWVVASEPGRGEALAAYERTQRPDVALYLSRLLERDGDAETHRQVLDGALAGESGGHREKLQLARARLALQSGETDDAGARLSECAGMMQRDPEWLALCARLDVRLGRFHSASAHYEEAAHLFDVEGRSSEAAMCRGRWALVLRRQGCHGQAEAMLQDALASTPDPHVAASLWLNLGNLCLVEGRVREAVKAFACGLEAADRAEDRVTSMRIMSMQLACSIERGDLEYALEVGRGAVTRASALGDALSATTLQINLASVRVVAGEQMRAEVELRRILVGLGPSRARGQALAMLGISLHLQGRLDDALEASEEGLVELGCYDMDRRRRLLLPFAMLVAEQGDVPRARALLTESGSEGWPRVAAIAWSHVEAVAVGAVPDEVVPTDHAERLVGLLSKRLRQ